MSELIFAPAKINLWLRVFAPDQTGYHPLDTLFCALHLADEITLEQHSNGIQLDVSGADVGPDDRNLAYRAAVEFFSATSLPQALRITLNKKIPAGAGLGGGSSDAAAVLNKLNEMHGNVLPEADVMSIGARLGSDVPFFLCGSHLAHATGRGEILEGLASLTRREVLVVMPDFAIATRDAYAWLDDAQAYAQPRAGALPNNWSDVAAGAVNTFETVVFSRYPQLSTACTELRASGAQVALLSGSGSAIFGIFDDAAACERAQRALNTRLHNVTLLQTHTID
jgi:4-diphosphocytidyl-2-C-methyl-D-erythritol kinase